MSKIILSLVVDRVYLEPAFVTVVSILKYKSYYKSLKFVFIKSKDESELNSNNIDFLISEFKNKFDKDNFIEFLKIENTLPDFDKYHFSNTILYKIFLPHIFQNEEYVLNVDAGNIFFPGFEEFSNQINSHVLVNPNFVVGAFFANSDSLMPPQITNFSKFYPSGALLLFNTTKYFEVNFSERIINFFNQFCELLQYAEQEILCAILEELEVYQFPCWENVYLDDLSSYVGENYFPINQARLERCIYYKNPGSIKPWKIWNLNPNREVYLKIRQEISLQINLEAVDFIREERNLIKQNLEMFKLANLKSYETRLASKSI